MTPEQMRELADRLSDPCSPDDDDLETAADYLRQCAEQRPVAYKHTESDGSVAHFGADEAPCEKCVPLYAAPVPPQREPLSDEQITKGEYVLATKFSDGDPGDHWGVGFYDRFENGRHYVVDRAGQQIRGGGFRRAGRITVEVGIWLLSAAKSLEASPPGTVNLWTMLTERAHGIGGSDAE